MISNRLRGLLNLHMVISLLLVATHFLLYHSAYEYLPINDLEQAVSIVPFLLCVVVGMVASTHYYQSIASRFHRLSWIDSARISTRQTVLVALCIFAFMFAFKERAMSRLFIGSYLSTMWVALLFLNVGLPRFLCRIFFDRNRRVPTLFIGSRRSLERLRQWLASKEMLGLHPVGFLGEHEAAAIDGAPAFLGNLAALPRVLAERQVVQVVVLETPRAEADSQFIIETCQNLGCRLLIYSNLAAQLQHPLVTISEEGHHFYTLQEEPLEDPLNRLLKRVYDIAISLPVVVFILPPMMVVVWLMQRLQAPGSLFFRQERTGHGQTSFKIIKFRSMVDAKQSVADEARQARPTDQRIYPFGRFMRTYSIDEFPQFINVLKGEMSIVGPRPHLVAHDQEFSRIMKGYRTRFFVKPGITGLAQSQGLRGEITDPRLLEGRIKLDLSYVTQWSIWLDLQITVKTAWQIIFPPKSAY